MSNLVPKTKIFPDVPGVYFFKDNVGNILYVGKAKSLKNRISSYFLKTDDWKINALICEHKTIEFIETKSELEAQLLEAKLIKQFQPKYNILLKSGNPFIYILFTQENIPQIKLVRNKQDKGFLIGPFVYKNKARLVFNYLVRKFKLQLCKNNIESGCIGYHINICPGNCRSDFDLKGYIERLELVKSLFSGNISQYSKIIEKSIKEHNQNLEFEKAKNMYQYLNDIESLQETIKSGFSESSYKQEISAVSMKLKYDLEINIKAMQELGEILHMSKIPVSIDCFDISHFQGKFIVGSCVRFSNGKPNFKYFRKFKIKSLVDQNDYAAIQEIVSRRYKSILFEELPDIILIDGGKGQLSAALQVAPKIPIISLAKKEEIVYCNNPKIELKLDIKTNLGKLLIALRDYAHHFAISYHRTLRSTIF